MNIFWYSTIPSPYRIAAWSELSKKSHLKVYTFEELPPDRNWNLNDKKDLNIQNLKMRALGRGAIRIYFGVFEYPRNLPHYIIITGWASPICFSISRFARKNSIPYFIFYESTQNSHYSFKIVSRIRANFLKRASGVLVPGKASYQEVLNMGLKPQFVFLVGNTMDSKRFYDLREKRIQKPSEQGHRFTYIGRPILTKNIRKILRAFSKCASPKDHLNLAGFQRLNFIDSIYWYFFKYKTQCSRLGFIEGAELDNLYLHTDTLLLPSRKEVWGMVAAEAVLSGCGVIISNTCGISNEISSFRKVYVCNPNIKDMTLAMKKAKLELSVEPEDLQDWMLPNKFASNVISALKSIEMDPKCGQI